MTSARVFMNIVDFDPGEGRIEVRISRLREVTGIDGGVAAIRAAFAGLKGKVVRLMDGTAAGKVVDVATDDGTGAVVVVARVDDERAETLVRGRVLQGARLTLWRTRNGCQPGELELWDRPAPQDVILRSSYYERPNFKELARGATPVQVRRLADAVDADDQHDRVLAAVQRADRACLDARELLDRLESRIGAVPAKTRAN